MRRPGSRMTLALALAAALAGAAGAVAPPGDDSLQKIQKEMNLVYARGAKKGPDLAEVERLVGRAMDIATDHKGEAEGIEAYDFVLSAGSQLGEEKYAPLFGEVMDALIESHLDDDRLGLIVLQHLKPEPAKEGIGKAAAEYFTWVERDSKSEAVKAACAWLRASHDANAVATTADAKKQIAKLEALKAKYGTRDSGYGQTYGQMYDEQIETLKIIGTPAREIAGKDLDGAAFKLSDYKGKVVLLDFWGYW